MSHQDTDRSYRFAASSSSPQAGARLALGVGEALGSDVSRGLFVDTQGPDLRGDPLGVVRREVAHRAILPRPQGRHGDGHPRADTGGDLPGVPQDVDDLDRRAGDGAWSTPFAGACRRTSPTRFEVCGFAVFGVDGSRLELPRTESNEGRFSPAKARRPSRSKAKAQAAPPRRVRGRPATAAPARRRPTVRRCG